MAVETEASTADFALSETNINWQRLDKTRFHVIGAILFTSQCGLLHPTAVVKTRMQVAEAGFAHMPGFSVFRSILKHDGIPGIFRGFGTSAVGALPGRVLALTSLEVSKETVLKSTKDLGLSEATHIAMANGTAGLFSSIVSCGYFVPLDVVMDNVGAGRPSVMKTTKLLLQTDGWMGFYRGFAPRFLNMSIYGTSMIVTYELIKRLSVKQG